MNLFDYGRILVRRGWIMLLLAVIAAGSAYFLSKQQTPVYRASQLVLMQPARADLGLTEASKTLLENHVAYLYSSFRAQEVIDTLHLDMTPEQLKSDVKIAPDTNSLVIEIDVDLTDSKVAADVAREWGNLLVQYRATENQTVNRTDRIDANLQDNATVSLLRPSIPVNTLAGALLGVLLGGVVVFVLEYLESAIVRSREDLEALGLPVLASIPAMDK
jgi:protein tyrosine kinase modulator